MNKARKSLDECSDLGLRRLACAIIEGAVCDYRNYGRSIKRNEAKIAKLKARVHFDDEEIKDLENAIYDANREMKVCKNFFFSDRFKILAPDLDPQAVIEALDRQIAQYDPFPKKKRKRKYNKRIVGHR